MGSPAVDYDALASQHGGAPTVDYDALAQQHGGTAQAPEDTRSGWQKVKDNFIPSVINFVKSNAPGPTSSDLPMPGRKDGETQDAYWKRMQDTNAAATPGDKPEQHPLIAAAIQSAKDFASKIADPAKFFEDDPVGAVQTYGNLLRSGLEVGKGVVTGAKAVGDALPAGYTDIAKGTGKVAMGAALPLATHALGVSPGVEAAADMAGFQYGSRPLIRSGINQIKQGVQTIKATPQAAQRAALDAKLARLTDAFDPATAGKTDIDLSRPPVAGQQPMTGPQPAAPQSASPQPSPLAASPGQAVMPASPGVTNDLGAQPTTIPFSKSEVPSAVYQAAARAQKAKALAKTLFDGGITSEDAKLMTKDHWGQAAQAAGVNAPSLESQGQTMFELRQLENAQAHSQQLVQRLNSTGAMPAAQQLQQLMAEPSTAQPILR